MKPFAFVLMPFDESFDDVYNLGIKAAAEDTGIHAERLDEQLFDTNMLERIYEQIDRADIVIADMSARNPNVFYEVGYAHAKKKLTILLTSKPDDIPFDLKHRPHIVYESISQLKTDLRKNLEWAQSEITRRSTEPLRL